MNYLWKNSKRVIVYEKRFLPGVLWMGDFDIILTFKKNRIWCRQLRNVVNFSHATQKPHRWQPLGVSCINENYDRHKKRSCMEFHTASWPVRESNPGLRRERASSWPLDQQAVCFIIESRRRDSNTRPLRPERSALPNWATPRYDFLAFEAVLISDSYILSRLQKKCKRFFEKNWKSFKKLKKPFKINIFTLLTYISKLLWIT